MSRDRAYLLDILEAARLILDFVQGKSWEDFSVEIQCQDAVIRRLEIMGEASRRISETTKDHYPHFPWNEMTGMRNFLIHEYNEVDLHLIWHTVQDDLPDLIHSLEEILAEDRDQV